MSNSNQSSSSQIGLYHLDRVIGQGNFAIVRLATHTITDTKVAIKIIDKVRLDAENRRKVAREVEIMKLLEHPHVVRLYQVMETEQCLYLVTEYASKGEIFEYLLSNGKMAEEEAKKKFSQIVLAVDYCHLKGIVHRDLKAENLLLDEALNVKLADFGFSNHYCQNEMLKTWCGSPPYAAPELFEGKEYCGPPADVWSLGVVLYVMVCGALPFDGTNLQHLRARVLAGRFRIPYYMTQDCERLIRRMLQLDPSKRIPLSSVLKHRWMEGVAVTVDMTSKCHRVSSAGGETMVWNEQVLMEIQKMNCNVDLCKQAVQNRLYNDHAALYYLLLSKCERGQLSVPLAKPHTPHPRLSLSGVAPTIPQISIQKMEPKPSPSKPSNGPSVVPLEEFLKNGASGRADERSGEEAEQLIRDINLDRYLNHGRRHTLGAAHNSMMAEDIKRLEMNESSNNQLPNGFGSCNGEDTHADPPGAAGVGGAVIAWHAMPGSGAMGSSGIHPNFDHSSLSSVGGPMRPLPQQQYQPHPHQYLPLPKNPRMGRRVSDGGPYVAAYKLFIEKRNPQLPQIKSSTNIERCDSSNMNSTNSVKMLLQETQEKKGYGGLPNTRREWLQFKNQVYQQKQFPRATAPLTTMAWNQLLSNQSLQKQAPPTPDLRTQVQPFQDLQPNEIQEQLQKLHIQLPPDALVVVPTQQPQGQDYEPAGVSSILVDNGYAHHYTTSESNSSGGSSRKSSTGSSLIAQLLCPSPPALPISSPQTEGSSSAGSTYTHAPPSSSFPPSHLNGVVTMRRSSLQDSTAIPSKHSRPQRKTMGDLFSTTSKQLPSFPINIQPNPTSRSYRESSPTKGGSGLYSSSPTNSLTMVGRRSPNHEAQMDAIAEDCTEDSTTPTNIHPPAIIPSEVSDLFTNAPSSPSENGGDRGISVPKTVGPSGNFQSYSVPSTTPVDTNRQRRTGVHMIKCPIPPHMVSAVEAKMCNGISHLRGVGEDSPTGDQNGLHHLLSQPSPPIHPSVKQVSTNTPPILTTSQPQVLLGMLQAPVYNTLPSVAPAPPHTLISSEYIYSTNNYQVQTSLPSQAPSIVSCSQSVLDASTLLQMQISSNRKALSHILEHSGIPFLHQNNVFSVNHLGVQFQIHVTNEIQLQFIAGDTMRYQSLCTQLFSRLGPSVQ